MTSDGAYNASGPGMTAKEAYDGIHAARERLEEGHGPLAHPGHPPNASTRARPEGWRVMDASLLRTALALRTHLPAVEVYYRAYAYHAKAALATQARLWPATSTDGAACMQANQPWVDACGAILCTTEDILAWYARYTENPPSIWYMTRRARGHRLTHGRIIHP